MITRLSTVLSLLMLAGTALAGDIVGSAGPSVAVVSLDGKLPAKAAPKAASISQRGVKFDPGFIVVQVGQEVFMPNDDSVAHNVYSLSAPKKFNLGVYAEGESRSVAFDKPGVVALKCWLHARMNATIVVVPSAFYSIASNGRFRIAAVPAGTYKIVATPMAGPEIVRTVTVPATGLVTVNF
jgi:plastocyanin